MGDLWGSVWAPTGLCLSPMPTWVCSRSTLPQVSRAMLPPVVVEDQTPPICFLSAGEATRLVSGGQVVGGRKLQFINDLAVTRDGKKVYFTSSSSRWQRRDYLQLIMEATADGRYLSIYRPGRIYISIWKILNAFLRQTQLDFQPFLHFTKSA